MNNLVDGVNLFARHWWPGMVCAAWQGALVLGLALLALVLWRRFTPAGRYALLLVALAKFALPPVGGAWGLFGWTAPGAAPAVAALPVAAASPPIAAPAAAMQDVPPASGNLWMQARYGLSRLEHYGTVPPLGEADPPEAAVAAPPAVAAAVPVRALTPAGWALLVQLAGMGLIASLVVRHAFRLSRQVRAARKAPAEDWRALMVEIAERLGMGRLPSLSFSDTVVTPQAGGFWRRFILLPAWTASLPERERRILLAHELAHWRRRDPIVNWLQIAVQTVWWWNPLVWWLNRRLRVERELCCDDLVLGLRLAEAEPYSRTLVDLAGRLTPAASLHQAIGMAGSYPSLKRRIGRILDQSVRRRPRLSFLSVLTLAVFAALVLPGSPLQRPSQGGEPAKTETADKTENKDAKPPAPAPIPDKNAPGGVEGRVWVPGGTPAAGVLVEVHLANAWKAAAAEIRTDPEGRFELTLPRGTYWFRARAGNLGVVKYDGVRVEAGKKTAKAVELRMKDACVVIGTVTDDATGKPLAEVEIVTDNGDRTRTDAQGAFRIEGVSLGDHAVQARAPGMASASRYIDTTGRQTAEVRIRLKPGGVVQGTVTDQDGKPVAGATVRDHYSGSMWILAASRTKTDKEGRYRLEGYPLDTPIWSMGAEARGFSDASRGDIPFPEGRREVTVDFRLGPKENVAAVGTAGDKPAQAKQALRRLHGRVTGADGKPVAKARVAYGSSTSFVHYKAATANEEGEYTLDGVSANEDLVVTQATGYAPAMRRTAGSGDEKMDFTLEPGHWLAGRVVDDVGKPLEDIHVSVMMDCNDDQVCSGPYRYLIPKAITDADGRFRLESLPPKAVPVDFNGQGQSGIRERRLEVGRDDHVLVMKGPGLISGQVLDADNGQPVAEFDIFLDFPRERRPDDQFSGFSAAFSTRGVNYIDRNGYFALSGVNTGDTLSVIAKAKGYRDQRADRVVVPTLGKSRHEDLVLRLHKAIGFAGRVTEADGVTGLAGVKLTVFDTPDQGRYLFQWGNSAQQDKRVAIVVTGPGGAFAIESLGINLGSLTLEKSGYARTLLTGVDFTRPPALVLPKAATLEGTLLDDDGKPLAGKEIHCSGNIFQLFPNGQTDEQGRFAYTDLPAGKYGFSVMEGSGSIRRSVRSAEVTLSAGRDYRLTWGKTAKIRSSFPELGIALPEKPSLPSVRER